jgi:D-aminopeptidase
LKFRSHLLRSLFRPRAFADLAQAVRAQLVKLRATSCIMIGGLTAAIENALEIPVALISGEDVSTRRIARLLADGMTVWSVAAITGVSVSAVEAVARGVQE